MDELAALRRLVEVYSPTGQEAPAVREFGRLARELGYRFSVDRAGNGIATRGRSGRVGMYLGHIDTVEGELPVEVSSRAVAGRGASDAKASLVAALVAGTGLGPDGVLRIVAAVGEERDSRGARQLLRGPRPDFLVVGEPTGWSGVTIGYKGELRVVGRFTGYRSHLSAPEPSTADRAVAWVERMRRRAETRAGPSPFYSVVAKVVSLDTERVGGREAVTVDLDLRLPPGAAPRELLAETESPPRPESVDVVCAVEAVEVGRSDPVVRSLSTAIRRQGGHPTLYRKGGTSDLNLVGPVWKVPAAVYGPGDSHLDHTDRERTELDDLRRSIEVLRAAVADLLRPAAA